MKKYKLLLLLFVFLILGIAFISRSADPMNPSQECIDLKKKYNSYMDASTYKSKVGTSPSYSSTTDYKYRKTNQSAYNSCVTFGVTSNDYSMFIEIGGVFFFFVYILLVLNCVTWASATAYKQQLLQAAQAMGN